MKGWSPGLGFKKRPKVIRIYNNKTVRRGWIGWFFPIFSFVFVSFLLLLFYFCFVLGFFFRTSYHILLISLVSIVLTK